jgi:hemolysin activation/secretion protein
MCILEQSRGVGSRGKTSRKKRWFVAALLSLACQVHGAAPALPNQNEIPPEPSPIPVNAEPSSRTSTAPAQPIFIREFRVRGAHHIARGVVEETVYPFLGPGRTETDVEQARAALEKAYQDKGYQTVSVQIPVQTPKRGIVFLQVLEQPVGRLRVRNSRYFSLKNIKENAPSLLEGQVPNFNEVTQDILALNQLPDRRITPGLHAGVEPGTVDVDLTVKDTFPLHGSLELNNRYSPDTDPLRLNGAVSYNNLWQLGHSIGFSFQVSPEDLDQVKVFSGYYIARIPWVPWITFSAIGVKQESNVSTLGGIAVAGRGEVLGLRAIMTLPPAADFYHSFTLGLDYKHFDQGVNLATGQLINTPITYYPFSAAYSATWSTKGSVTDFDASINAQVRGLGSGDATFDLNRFRARGSFVFVRGSIAHTHDLPMGMQVFGKVQGQVASEPLVNSEQLAGGGLATVRGYLEAEALGDDGAFASFELRSPQLATWKGEGNDWRVYAFADGGVLTLHDPLPQQSSTFTLASLGVGTRFRFYSHLNGSLDVSLPLVDANQTDAFEPLVTFRLWADF